MKKRSWGLILVAALLLLVWLGVRYADSRFQANVQYNKGVTAYRENDMKLAIASFSETIRLAPVFCPEKADAYYWRGTAQVALGELTEAIDDFSEVIGLDPSNARGYLARCGVYRKTGDNARAKEDWQKAMELDHSLNNHPLPD